MDADVVVVGGGPGGATCAMFTARYGFTTVLIDQAGVGGQLINLHSVKDYPGFAAGVAGWDLAAALTEQVMAAGVAIEYGAVEGIAKAGARWSVDIGHERLNARAVVIATGGAPIPVPGPGTERLTGHGISYCATCDGGFFRGQKVAVLGGGDFAMSEASYLTDVAGEVVVMFEETAPMAADAWVAEATRRANVSLMPRTKVTEALGESGVTGLRYTNLADGSEAEIAVSGVFGASGLIPNSGPFRAIVDTGETGAIRTNDAMACSAPGVFAAGDVRAGALFTVAAAVGDGARAAVSVRRYLRGEAG